MDNIEREIKVLGVDLEEFEKKLKSLGAIHVKSENQINFIYDNSEKYLESKGGYLRIRVSKVLGERTTTLTYKEILNSVDMRENLELNLNIENIQLEIVEEILKKLGYFKISTGHKYRIRYNYRNYIIDLDSWDKNTYPFDYVEIEMKGEESEEELKDLLTELNLENYELTTESIRDLQKRLN